MILRRQFVVLYEDLIQLPRVGLIRFLSSFHSSQIIYSGLQITEVNPLKENFRMATSIIHCKYCGMKPWRFNNLPVEKK